MKIIGHRGARGLAPENTLQSLEIAISHHVDAVEFDIRITSDGVGVLSHNRHLQDSQGKTYNIHDYTYEALLGASPSLCTLETALRTINRRVQAMIEIKPGENPQPVVDVIEKLLIAGWISRDFAFLSFDYRILQALHRSLPDVPIVINEKWSSIRAVSRARRLQTTQIDMNSRWLWPGVIRGLSRRGYQLYTFTLNDVARARRWQAHGLAGVITDFPDRYE